MPVLLPTDEIQPGMKLAEPIFSDGQVILQNGRPLTPNDVDALRRRFPSLRVRVEDETLDSAVEFEDDRQERDVATEAQRRVSDCMCHVGQRFSAHATLEDADLAEIEATVHELIAHLHENHATAALVAQCLDRGTFLGAHTGNVFYLSLLLGSAVLHLVAAERKRAAWARDIQRDFAHDLTPLGLGVLVMDVGLLAHQALLQKAEPLSPEEHELLRQHPLKGAELLPKSFNGIARMVVKTHHEDFQGTGYPGEMQRGRLHIFARIVRIADAFDAATSQSVFAEARSPARALWEMSVGPYRKYFDPEIVKALCRLVQPFPVGAKLKLTDGREAAVVRYNRRQPFDPVVVIATDPRGRPLPKEQIQPPFEISTVRGLRIASQYGEDLSFIYGAPDHAPVNDEAPATVFDMFYP